MIVGNRRIGKPVEYRKAVYIVPDFLIVSMEDMRAVDMDVDPLHSAGIDISSDMGAAVNDQDFFSGVGRFPGKYRSKQACACDQIVIHCLSSLLI